MEIPQEVIATAQGDSPVIGEVHVRLHENGFVSLGGDLPVKVATELLEFAHMALKDGAYEDNSDLVKGASDGNSL